MSLISLSSEYIVMASLCNARVDNCDIQFHASAVLSISATIASFIAKLSHERRICRNYQDGRLEFVNPGSDNTDSFIRFFLDCKINCSVEEFPQCLGSWDGLLLHLK